VTSFEFFRGRCENTKYFYCQIVLKDCTLQFIENDLPKLCSVNEDSILYFVAVWETFEIMKNGKIKSRGGFMKISSNSIEVNVRNNDFRFAPYTVYGAERFSARCFGLNILFSLHDEVDAKILETYIPKLYENYVAQNRLPKEFGNDWETAIMHWECWKHERNLFLGLSPEDKALYELVGNLIGDFDWIIPLEADVSGDGGWWAIVWNTIQIARNGGGEDDIYKHLFPHASIMGAETKPELAENEILLSRIDIRNKKRMEVATKIVKLIQEA